MKLERSMNGNVGRSDPVDTEFRVEVKEKEPDVF